jgi:hypothetical protein
MSLTAVLGAGAGLQLQPLAWLAIAVVVVISLVTVVLNTRRAARAPKVAYPTTSVVTYVGGGRWTRLGILRLLDARWPLVRLTVGTNSLYFGPNEQWPLWRIHSIPQCT